MDKIGKQRGDAPTAAQSSDFYAVYFLSCLCFRLLVALATPNTRQ